MIKRLVITEELTPQTMIKAIAFFEEVGDTKSMVYFSSNGGEAWIGESLRDLFNDNPKCVIELVHEISSAAFIAAIDSKNKVLLNKYFSYGILHQTTNTVDLRELNSNWKNDSNIAAARVAEIEKEESEYVKKILTKEEVELYNNGEHVFLDRNRIKEVLAITKSNG